MRRKASRNNKNAICNAIENTCKQKQNRHTLMVGWEKPVTRYNKNNNKKNKNKNLHVTRSAVPWQYVRMLEIENGYKRERE